MYSAYIARIKSLRKHSNATRLQVGTVFGNNVIVGLDITEGELGVYFPTDGKVGVEFAKANNLLRLKDSDGNNIGGYLDPDKRNIRAINLRGEKSDGLFLPLTSLNGFCVTSSLKEGDAITILNGVLICEKYIPYTEPYSIIVSETKKSKMEPRVKYPLFKEHSDTPQLVYNLGNFNEGDQIVVTLKMHGTSQRTSYTIQETRKPRNFLQRLIFQKLLNIPAKVVRVWTYITGTRRTVLTPKAVVDGGYYGSNAFRIKHHDLFMKGQRLKKGETIYYEVVGYVSPQTPIMATCSNWRMADKEFIKQYGGTTVFNYGCVAGESDIYVYRMTMTNEDGDIVEYPWDLVKLRCEQMGVKFTPEIERFNFTDEDDLMVRINAIVDGADPIGKTHIREGVIVRINNKERFVAYKHKSFVFKVLEGIVKDTATTPDIEEV